MASIIISLLISLGYLNSAADVDTMSTSDREHLEVIVIDLNL